MADVIAPSKTVTFTVTSKPRNAAAVKTIQRLMTMQRKIQAGLEKLAIRRDRVENIRRQRAGRFWINRVTAPRLVQVTPGAEFTLRLTPQIIADVRSVERYLTAK